MIFSRGNAEPAWSFDAELLEDNFIRISWEIPESLNRKAVGGHLSQVLMYSEQQNTGFAYRNSAIRSDPEYIAKIPGHFQGAILHILIFFVSADGKLVSDTEYAGAIQLKAVFATNDTPDC